MGPYLEEHLAHHLATCPGQHRPHSGEEQLWALPGSDLRELSLRMSQGKQACSAESLPMRCSLEQVKLVLLCSLAFSSSKFSFFLSDLQETLDGSKC